MIISFIIPTYNCAPYLEYALESILSQGLFTHQYEVIIINDGSSDNSEVIAMDFCKKYNNFRYYFQENQGVAYTRNRGISLARGEYIHFMDADDWLLPGGMRTLIDKYIIPNHYPDIITFNSRTVDKYYNPKQWDYINNHMKTFDGNLLEFTHSRGVSNSVWNNIFSRDLLIKSGIKFSHHKIAEDMLFMLNLFNLESPSIIATNLNIYRYRVHNQSALNNTDREHIKQIIYDLNDIINILEKFKNKANLPIEIIEKDIDICRRWAFTKLCSGGFTYKEISKLIKENKMNYNILNSSDDKINSIINVLLKTSFFTFCFSIFYKNLFLPFIKPFITRN